MTKQSESLILGLKSSRATPSGKLRYAPYCLLAVFFLAALALGVIALDTEYATCSSGPFFSEAALMEACDV